MIATVRIHVESKDLRGDIIPDTQLTWSATMKKTITDPLLALKGNGAAQVQVEHSEKLGGAGYSSTGVVVSITLTCNQDQASIRQAAQLAKEESFALVDAYIDDAVRLLQGHLERFSEG